MKKLFGFAMAVVLAGASLASCTTTSQDIEVVIRDNLPKTCALANTAHAAFVAAAASGDIAADVIKKEQAAYDGVQVICADPSKVTAENALVLVAQAYATISLSLKAAKLSG